MFEAHIPMFQHVLSNLRSHGPTVKFLVFSFRVGRSLTFESKLRMFGHLGASSSHHVRLLAEVGSLAKSLLKTSVVSVAPPHDEGVFA